MRNVTIVESNVEPNKEHLWFYNGKLKWFGPNGWEDICVCKFPSPSSTTTTTPKPVVSTTTTTSTPKPGPTPIPNSIRLTNRTKVSLILTRVNWVDNGTSSPPIQPNQQHILVHNANDANNDSYIEIYVTPISDALLPFSSLKITAFNNEGQEYDVPYEHYQDAMGTNLYKFSFKELINKGVTEVSIYGSLENSTTTTSTTTTSTALSTFKLINNTGDTLNIMGLGYIDGGVSTSVPPVPNGGSVLLIKYRNEGVWLQSHSNSKLGIIVDGENRGELPLGNQGSSPWYELSKSIFNNATEISVYSVGA